MWENDSMMIVDAFKVARVRCGYGPLVAAGIVAIMVLVNFFFERENEY